MKRYDTLPIRQGLRSRYAWPGGYPISLVTRDGGLLCWECARDNRALIVRDTRYGIRSGWDAIGWDVFWEVDEDGLAPLCDHCGGEVEVAYPK